MNEFRRFIIGLAEGLQVVGIACVTLAFGAIGAAIGHGMFSGPFVSFAAHRMSSVAELIGFIVGGFVGFTISATAAALLFTLSQIENNTRQADLEPRVSTVPGSMNERTEPRF